MVVPLNNVELLTSEIHAPCVQIEHLKSLVQSISKSPFGTSSLAMTGKHGSQNWDPTQDRKGEYKS